MNWQSYAPIDLHTEWKWDTKARKWIKVNNPKIKPLYDNTKYAKSMRDAALENYHKMQKQAQYYPNRGYIKEAKQSYNAYLHWKNKHDDLVNQYDSMIENVRRENQEANAWGHQYYNDFHYYKTDTLHQPTYWAQLNGMSIHQLKKSQQFWQNQIFNINKHGHPKDKKYWTYGGDASRVHVDSNWGDHHGPYGKWGSDGTNLLYTLTSGDMDFDKIPNSTQRAFTGVSVPLDHYFNSGNQMYKDDTYSIKWNAALLHQEQLRAQLAEQSKHGMNYSKLKSQYNAAESATNDIQKMWTEEIHNTHNKKAENLLKRIFTRGKRQVEKRYYLDNSYLNHDKQRLAEVNQALRVIIPRIHQQEIDNSIREQLESNDKDPWPRTMGNHDGPYWTSLYRRDKKTDTVARIAELSPSESWDLNANQHSVDEAMPETDFAQMNQAQLTEQGVLYAPNDKQRVQQYDVLLHWMEQKRILVIHGFNNWARMLITNLGRSPRQEAPDNGMNISITFLDIRLAKIKFGKQKPKARKSKGRNKKKNGMKKIKIKSGMTYWGEAQKYHIPLKKVMGSNSYAARRLPIGGTMKIPL